MQQANAAKLHISLVCTQLNDIYHMTVLLVVCSISPGLLALGVARLQSISSPVILLRTVGYISRKSSARHEND